MPNTDEKTVKTDDNISKKSKVPLGLERLLRIKFIKYPAWIVGFIVGLHAVIASVNAIGGIEIPTVHKLYIGWTKDREVLEITTKADRLFFKTSDGKKSVTLYQKGAQRDDPYSQAIMAIILSKGLFGQEKDTLRANQYSLKALPKLELTSQKNIRDAYALGYLFHHGIGFAPNNERAISLYEFGAVNGHAPSQYMLALIYDKGRIRDENDERALDYYISAANQGHLNAMTRLGLAYRFGWGTMPSISKAVELLEAAGKLGDPIAQEHLGEIYEQGELGQADIVMAESWYSKAAAKGQPYSLFKNAALLYNRGGDKLDAFRAFEDAALKGQPGAHFNLALFYENPEKFDPHGEISLQRDIQKSIKHLKLAADGGWVEAQLALVEILGGGVTRIGTNFIDFEEAVRFASLCAETISPLQGICQFRHAYLIENSLGIKKDIDKVIQLYEASMTNGTADAGPKVSAALRDLYGTNDVIINQRRLDVLLRAIEMQPANGSIHANLGHLYLAELQGIPGGPELAANAFKEAAENGSANGACNVGIAYLHGRGFKPNLNEAVRWMKVAAGDGLIPPLKNLMSVMNSGQAVDITLEDLLALRDRGLAKMEEQASVDGCTANLLGQRYERGEAISRDYLKAIEWYERAYVLGSVAGAYNFGRLNLIEGLLNANPKKGLDSLKSAASADSGPAHLLLASLYYKSTLVEPDEKVSLDHFLKAKKLDAPLSQNISTGMLPEEWTTFLTGRTMACKGNLQATIK